MTLTVNNRQLFAALQRSEPSSFWESKLEFSYL